MARDAREFWQALERRLPESESHREREIAQTVLVLLRHRIRPEEAQHLKAELPDELKELWATRGIGLAEKHTARNIVEMDHNWFLTGVKDMARLPDMDTAAKATSAVFGAVREIISDTEADHVERQLPSGLKELWRGGHARKGPHHAQGEGPFWDELSDRLEGRVRATDGEVACSVLAHLHGRLPRDLARRIHDALPDDIAEYWVAPPAGAEADEPPERFIGRIAQDLGIEDLAEASHAAAATMAALRTLLPEPLAREAGEALPEELRGLWEGM